MKSKARRHTHGSLSHAGSELSWTPAFAGACGMKQVLSGDYGRRNPTGSSPTFARMREIASSTGSMATAM